MLGFVYLASSCSFNEEATNLNQIEAVKQKSDVYFVFQRQVLCEPSKTVRFIVYENGDVELYYGMRTQGGLDDFDFKKRITDDLVSVEKNGKWEIKINDSILLKECVKKIKKYKDIPFYKVDKSKGEGAAVFVMPFVFDTMYFKAKTYTEVYHLNKGNNLKRIGDLLELRNSFEVNGANISYHDNLFK